MADDSVRSAFLSEVEKKPFLYIQPGTTDNVDLYAGKQNREVKAAEVAVSTGRFKVSANNLSMNGTSAFQFNSSSLVGDFVLSVSIVCPSVGMLPHGWLFKAINQLQITFSPSVFQNLTINSQSLFDYAMLSCQSKTTRDELLWAAGKPVVGDGGTYTASIPLSFILANNSNLNGFPIDLSTILSMTINVVWNSPGYFFQDPSNGSTWDPSLLPTSFLDAYITCTSVDIQNQDFSMRSILNKNQDSGYVVPVKYLTSEVISLNNYTPGSQINQQLQGFIAGICTDVIVSCHPTSWDYENTYGYVKRPYSCDFDSMSLEYAGQAIFQFQKTTEYKASCIQKWGEVPQYDYLFSISGSALTASNADAPTQPDVGYIARRKDATVYDIPLSYRPGECLRDNRLENIVSYAGKALNLKAVVGANDRDLHILRPYYSSATTLVVGGWDIERDTLVVNPTGDYTMNITYVNEAALVIENGLIRVLTE